MDKYEEALQRARELYETGNFLTRQQVGIIFPELRESEDERMRKRAIAILKYQRDYWSYDGPMEKCPPATPLKDLVDAIDVALSYLEKQKEQKPAEVDEYKIIKKHITEGFLSSEVNKRLKECGWYVTDEKPAEWSEVDEKTRKNLMSLLANMRADRNQGGYLSEILLLAQIPPSFLEAQQGADEGSY